MINHIQKICEQLGVESIEEAVEQVNKKNQLEGKLPVTVEEIQGFQDEINRLYDLIMENQKVFGAKKIFIKESGDE